MGDGFELVVAKALHHLVSELAAADHLKLDALVEGPRAVVDAREDVEVQVGRAHSAVRIGP